MNLRCFQCQCLFSVDERQLGRRGFCPNCRVPISIPRSGLGAAGQNVAQSAKSLTVARDHWIAALSASVMVVALLGLTRASSWLSESIPPKNDPAQVVALVSSTPKFIEPNAQPLQPRSSSLDSLTWLRSSALAPDATIELNSALQAGLAVNDFGTNRSASSNEVQPTPSQGNDGESVVDFEALQGELRRNGLDLVILFDSTQSMKDEIAQVQRQIGSIGETLFRLVPKTQIAICTYRDQGDVYQVKGQPLSDNLGRIVGFVSSIDAAGGGDEFESVDEGLRWVLANNEFRPGAHKVLLLFGDVPAHPSEQNDCLDLVLQFRRMGGTVSTVTCRGQQPLPAFVDMATVGGGEAFLTGDPQQIVERLVVLIFGSRYRDNVMQVFRLSD